MSDAKKLRAVLATLERAPLLLKVELAAELARLTIESLEEHERRLKSLEDLNDCVWRDG